jgi:sialate O-acetylesterase
MMKKYLQRIGPFLTLLFTLSTGHLRAGDFALNRLFSDHMVLQRNQPIRIFGTGTDRSEVVVRLAGQEARSTVRDGSWEVQLPAMTAGGPHTIEVVGPQKLTLSDVMIGDVWVGSGQSNMGMALKSMPEYAIAPQSFGNPRVRVFKAKVTPAETPQREIQRVKTTTMDGWSAADPTNSGEISAVGYYFCHAVQRELGVPIGLIHSAQGATSVEAWLDDEALRELMPESKRLNALTNPKNPSVFYNGMIAPLQRFPIKGIIWYQGESGGHNPRPYQALFSKLIVRWREQWGLGDIPFYWVQLASFPFSSDKSGEAWAWVREAQDKCRSLPNTGMAVALDRGEYGDIHPRKKLDLGERLALLALRAEEKSVIADGPRFNRVEFASGQAVVHFLHADGLEAREVVMNRTPKLEPGADPEAFRASAGELAGFEVAGSDGTFVAAKSLIKGPTVVVSSPLVSQPRHVRYAWKNFALANLYNAAGLPAEPFRTDNFPLPETITQRAEAFRKSLNNYKSSPTPTQAEDPR